MESPKRRKYKDNPYKLIMDNNKYIISFNDSKNTIQNIEVSKEVFDGTLNKRAINKNLLTDEIVEYREEREKLIETIKALPKVQKRRIIKYYYENKTLEEIAEEENCTKMAIKFTIDIAIEKISKKLVNGNPF